MATYNYDPKVGDLVYEPFYRQNPGVVRNVSRDEVTVEWLRESIKRPKITILSKMRGVGSFTALIEEHDRKAKKFREMVIQLRLI